MREPRPVPGAKTPLFDRLSDDGIDVRRPVSSSKAMDLSALRESVRRDLSNLLNTRTSLRGGLRDLAQGTVLDFGVPPLNHISPSNDDERMGLAVSLEKIINTFEPRLRRVKVLIQADKKDPRMLIGVVTAELVFGNIVEPVYFPLTFEDSGKKIDVAGS